MKNDWIAILGIITLATIFSISPKVGGTLIIIVTLGMLLQVERLQNGFST